MMGIFSVKKSAVSIHKKYFDPEKSLLPFFKYLALKIKIVFKSLPFPTWTKFREKVAKILVWKYVWT